MASEVVECMECSSPMVFRDHMWQCDNCFSVLTGAGMKIDDVPIDEGLTMGDVMQQYDGRHSDR